MKEPIWWENLLKFLNDFVAKNDVLSRWMPILSDVFVFTYPVYLLGLYFYGIKKKDTYYQDASLVLFFSGFGSLLVNVVIQGFVEKARPDVILNIINFSRDSLIMQSLPKDTFPSDHAAMASAIATVTLLWWLKHKDRFFVFMSLPMILFALIMGFGRIAIWVHWPTDIFVGTVIWIAVSFIFMEKHILAFFRNNVFNKIILIQEKIFNFFGL